MNILQGLARGVMEGGGKTLSTIGAANVASNFEKERAAALEAKELRILELRQKAEEGLLEKRGAQEQEMFKQRSTFEAEQNRENNARADRRAAAGNRISANEQKQATINQLMQRYLTEKDPAVRQQIAADLNVLEGRKVAGEELVEMGQDLTGAKRYDLKSNIVESLRRGGDGTQNPGAPATGPWMQFQKGGGTSAPVTQSNATPSPPRASTAQKPVSVRDAYNLGIRNKLNLIQQEMSNPALSAQEKLAMNQEYAKFQQMLRK